MNLIDFGTSLADSSTLQFKTSWGAKVISLPSYIYHPQKKELRLDPGGFGVRFGRKVWQSLPQFMCDRIGPMIAAYTTS